MRVVSNDLVLVGAVVTDGRLHEVRVGTLQMYGKGVASWSKQKNSLFYIVLTRILPFTGYN